MLEELIIKNIAIIDKQEVTFEKGLNVITGESGAGKSVILHALELVLGAKPKAHAIRAGCDTGEVQATFSLTKLPKDVRDSLPEICEAHETEDLCITRIISAQGRGKIFVNGKIVSLSLLEEIGSSLMTICGQNQQVKLLQSPYHRVLLDEYGEHQALCHEVQECFRSWNRASSELEGARKGVEQAALRKAELEGIAEDLSTIEITAGMRGMLEGEIRKYAVAEQLKKITIDIRALASADEGVFSNLRSLQALVRDLVRLEASSGTTLNAPLIEAATALESFERNLISYQRGITIDDSQLESLREQLSELARLERKYRINDEGLVNLKQRVEKEILEADSVLDIKKLEAEEIRLKHELELACGRLTKKRSAAAKELEKVVSAELAEVGMKGSTVAVQLRALEHWTDHGAENVEFMIAAGSSPEAPRYPLKEIASGGELSRVLLVLKKVLRDRSGVNVLVFDEVDTGISGGVARGVGEKLKSLAKDSQVLCITHLPQVASLADNHIRVSKDEKKGLVKTVEKLSDKDKIDEIARMLSGHEVTKASQLSAKELLGMH
jgi:DNA repair protein RecN (Recombination protein N)